MFGDLTGVFGCDDLAKLCVVDMLWIVFCGIVVMDCG